MEFPRPINGGDPNYLLSGMILQGAETWPTNQPTFPKTNPKWWLKPWKHNLFAFKEWNEKKTGGTKRGWNKMLAMFMPRIHLKAMTESLKHYQKKLFFKVWERCSLFYCPILDCITEFDSNTGKKSCTSSCTPKTVRNEMHSLHQVVCNLFSYRGIYSSSTL